MASFDTVIRGGKVATASDVFSCEIGIFRRRAVDLAIAVEHGVDCCDRHQSDRGPRHGVLVPPSFLYMRSAQASLPSPSDNTPSMT